MASTNFTGDGLCNLPETSNFTELCLYVLTNNEPCEGGGYIKYTSLLYCSRSACLIPLLLLLLSMLSQLFVALGVAADSFFCPNVAVIVQQLKISQNIAGVTLLAFGNGSPDIFSSIASVLSSSKPKPGLAIGSLLGAAMFVSTVVVALVTLVQPFDVMRRPLIRDLLFFVATVIWLLVVFIYKNLNATKAISFIVVYIIYALVVIIGRYLRMRASRQSHFEEFENEIEESTDEVHSTVRREDSVLEEALWNYHPNTNHQINLDLPPISEHNFEESITIRINSSDWLYDFWRSIRPLSLVEWKQTKFIHKIYLILKLPFTFLLRISIPLVDKDAVLNNWCKPLLILQCVLCPILVVLFLEDIDVRIGNVMPVWLLAFIVGTFVACVMHLITVARAPPKYHQFLAWVGFLMAIFWIFCIAREVIGIVTALGVVAGVSQDVLGLTLVAWSNSLGDLVANIGVAKQGFPRMAISACFGGPLFNILLGFGIPFTIVTVKMGVLELELTPVRKVLLGFVLWSLVSSLVLLPLSRFRASRPYAVYLLIVYVVFLVTTILTEKTIIHIP